MGEEIKKETELEDIKSPVKEEEIKKPEQKKEVDNLYTVLDYLAENLGLGVIVKEAIISRDKHIKQLKGDIEILQQAVNDTILAGSFNEEEES